MGEDHHEGESHEDHKAPQFRLPLYSRCRQRQQWGDTQILPHTNWGDTFFDLFYVAGAYNLGNMIRTDLTANGVLYFLGGFFAIQLIWVQKMYYDSRFFTPDDTYHRFYEFAVLVTLASAVLYLRPVDILSHPDASVDMFALSMSLLVATVLSIGRYIEAYFFGICQQGARIAALRDIIYTSVSLAFYAAAAIVSGLAFYRNHEKTDPQGSNYEVAPYSNTTYSNTTQHAADDDHHRQLAAAVTDMYHPSSEVNDIPMILVLTGALSFVVCFAIMILTMPGGGRHKEVTTPINVTFAIHRWGEWTMLMLGETALSLLIVDIEVESMNYFKTFFCGIISITLLEFLHFRSQPHDADDHALRRTKESGGIFTILMQVYSAALVALGTSYKMLAFEFAYETQGYRMLSSDSIFGRLLAGGDIPSFGREERRQREAHYFSASMAVVWLCSDLMIINHRGFKDNLGRCRMQQHGSLKYVGLVLALVRVGLVVFIATLSQYVTEPQVLAFVGLVGIVVQVLLRVIGTSLFGKEYEHDGDDDASVMWPNVTRPAVQSSERKISKSQ